MIRPSTAFYVRTFAYLLAVGGLAYVVTLEGYRELTASQYGETSLNEGLHAVATLLASACFVMVARIDEKLRTAAVMLAGLVFAKFIREQDSLLDHHVFDGSWQLLVAALFVLVAAYVWRHRSEVRESLDEYALQFSAGVFLSGFVVTVLFSRLIGRARFWQGVMGENYDRVIKNIAEEGTESLGYGLIAIAAVDLLIVSLARKRGRTRN